MAQRVEFVVHGLVQGVNFRNFTRHKATELNIVGKCWNTNDRKVQGVAQGDAEAMEKFLTSINVGGGPTHARVSKLDKVEKDALEEGHPDLETSFSVIR